MSERRIRIVAHRTAASPKLSAAVAERAAQIDALGPSAVLRAGRRGSCDHARARGPVARRRRGLARDRRGGDPFEAGRQALERERYAEVTVSTLPARGSRWLRLDLPHRVERFGAPVGVVTVEQGRAHAVAGRRPG